MNRGTSRGCIGPRGLLLVCLAAPLAACTTTEQQQFAADCHSRGFRDGTDGMAKCMRDERQAAQNSASQAPTGSAYIPPTFQGTGPGCYNCN